jgi:AcrR family transcriptional regulator
MSRPYESQTRKAQAEETRRRILSALVDLLVHDRPATISVPQVAKRAGVSVRIVYHYFPSKEALFDAVLEEMPAMVVVPEGFAGLRPRTPEQFADALPLIFRYLDENRAMFRAVSHSEFAERAAAHRSAERIGRVDTALAPLADQLDPAEQRRLRAVIGALTSFAGFDAMTTTWGLDPDEAADVAAWAVRTLSARARRSGVSR